MMHMNIPGVVVGTWRLLSGHLDYQIIWATFSLNMVWVERTRDDINGIANLFEGLSVR